MPDDEGRRRRLGDETKNRIADLASGWSLDGTDEPPSPAPAHTPKPLPEMTRRPAAPAPAPAPARAAGPAPDPRSKPRTGPPPPPGSAARKVLEDTSGGGRTSVDDASGTVGKPIEDRSGAVTSARQSSASGRIAAPPPAQPSAQPQRPGAAAPRSGPQYKRAGYTGPQAPFSTEGRTFSSEPRTPAVIVDESLSGPVAAPLATGQSTPIPAAPSKPAIAPTPPAPKRAMPLPPPHQSSIPGLKVPVGEFDSGVQTIEQSTFQRDAADARPLSVTPVEELLDDDLVDDDGEGEAGDDASTRIDASAGDPPRDDATMIDPQTAKFERGDPTAASAPDSTVLQSPSTRLRHPSGGTLRPSAALRRKRGALGDVRYVFTAVFGVHESRRELAELEHRQGLRQTSRRRHLVTLGRTAVSTDTFDHPALGEARERLQGIEDERSRHAGAVSASDAEFERVRRDRDAKAKRYIEELAAIDAELAELHGKLEPLEKEATSARKRGQELREALQRIDKKIVDTERLLDSVKAEKLDKGAILADIATYKADRHAVLRDEPVIAAELDALNPRIAAIEGNRNDLRRKRGELDKAEVEDQRRAAELLDAIGAKRKVVERAAADAEAARDHALFELGDRLYVDRPKVLAAQLSPIDQIDLELGEGDRRMMELREILSNIDKAKFARGAALIVLALAVVGGLVAAILYAAL